MKKTLTWTVLPAMLLVLTVFHSNVMAQYEMFSARSSMSSGRGIRTTGQAELEKQPTVIRMHIDITASGDSLEKALKNLDRKVNKAKKKIAKLKSVKDSIKVGIPQVSASNNQQQNQVEMMIRRQLANSGRKPPKGLKMLKVVTVKTTFKADWPLDAQTPSEQLLMVDELKTEIEKSDISGQKDKKKLSAEEEELLAETKAMRHDYYNSNDDIKPGTPVFLYIAKASEKETKKLMLEAFQKANQNARELTNAVNVPLGKLVSLSGGIQKGGSNTNNEYNYEMRQYMERLGVQESLGKNEAISTNCGPVKFQAHVVTVFEMQ